MESDDSNPVQLIQNWTLKTISKHVLHLLEILTNALRQQFQGNYFFEQQNLFVNPGNIFIDDYNEIGEQIQNYMTQLYDISLEAIKGSFLNIYGKVLNLLVPFLLILNFLISYNLLIFRR